ncbi:MAG: hypothetical protein LBE35_09685 [Clostridiales bacterium]|jgi:hypothetical protein|nr:hypothetical protein [Clostridiales bacterium]
MLITSKWKYEDLEGGANFSSLAFDGRFFFLAGLKAVYIYSKDFERLDFVQTPEISTLCYDNGEDCFWAAAASGREILKLSRRFDELARIGLDRAVYDLSYFCAHDSLLAATACGIIEICKHADMREIRAVSGHFNVLAIAPFYAIHEKDSICFYAPDGILHSTLFIPKDHEVLDILFYHPENELLALARPKSGKGARILRHPMPCMDICDCNYTIPKTCVL